MKISEERGSKQRRKESLAHRHNIIKTLGWKRRAWRQYTSGGRHRTSAAAVRLPQMNRVVGSQSKTALKPEPSPEFTCNSMNSYTLSMARSDRVAAQQRRAAVQQVAIELEGFQSFRTLGGMVLGVIFLRKMTLESIGWGTQQLWNRLRTSSAARAAVGVAS